MNVLVLGGTRFIGPPVVRRLAAAGHDITVLHRGATEASLPSSVRHAHMDRADAIGLRILVQELRPDVVIDMAALTEVDAQVVVEAVRGIVGRLVVVSSQDVYSAYGRFHGNERGPNESGSSNEDSELRTSLYPYRGKIVGLEDYEKLLVERAAVSAPELPATILRLPATYGERDDQHRLALELRKMDDRRPALLVEETLAGWRWTRSYADNAAEAIALAATDARAVGRVYNVGDHAMTYTDWVRAIGLAAGWHGEVTTLPAGRLPAHLRPPAGDYAQHLVADTTRIRSELGYDEPVALKDGLRRAISWERSHRGEIDPRALNYEAEDAVLGALG